MKNTLKFTFATTLMALVIMSFGPSPKQAKPGATMAAQVKWNKTLHDFGKFQYGPDAVFVFNFKNSGKKPVLVQSAQPGCSCTVSDFTKTPVGKNKTGSVTAKYVTKERPGYFKKTITVTFEDGSTQVLTVTGDVVLP